MECNRKKKGMKMQDNHHFAGKSNSPVTVSVPTNDHVSELNTAQQDWPKRTLQNPDGSPFLAAAACIRGFADTVVHLIEKGVRWVVEMLEKADAWLRDKLGQHWWIRTPLEPFAPKA
jgi:hypothetical protein